MSLSCRSFATSLALVASAAAGTLLGPSTRGTSPTAVPIIVEASKNIAQDFRGVPALQSFVSASLDSAYEQKMGTYACATMVSYDSETRSMYTSFFGGISHWTWSYENQRSEKVPLIGGQI